MTIIDNSVLQNWNMPRERNSSHTHTHTQIRELMDLNVWINMVGWISSQCKHMSNHHMAHFKYLKILLYLKNWKINTHIQRLREVEKDEKNTEHENTNQKKMTMYWLIADNMHFNKHNF